MAEQCVEEKQNIENQEMIKYLPAVLLVVQHLKTKTADYGSMEMTDW